MNKVKFLLKHSKLISRYNQFSSIYRSQAQFFTIYNKKYTLKNLTSFYKFRHSSFSKENSTEEDKSFCFAKESQLSEKPIEETTINAKADSIILENGKQRILYKDIMEITKFKLCVLNLSVSLSTYILYSSQITMLNLPLFAVGTLSIAMTTQVLNQIMEKIYDKKMKRTQMRPLPRQRMSTKEAYTLAFGLWSLSIVSFLGCSPQSIIFTGAILSLYIFCYTPLKRINNLSMHVGALVGSLPALLGPYAVNGYLNLSFNDPAFLLASYIFCWQYPHFYGILYQNKEDYSKAGFKFISNDETKIKIAYAQLLVACITIIAIVFKIKERKIMNNYTCGLFFAFYAYNLIPAVLFITNPTKYSKIMRVRSYTPFLIILASFLNASTNKGVIINNDK